MGKSIGRYLHIELSRIMLTSYQSAKSKTPQHLRETSQRHQLSSQIVVSSLPKNWPSSAPQRVIKQILMRIIRWMKIATLKTRRLHCRLPKMLENTEINCLKRGKQRKLCKSTKVGYLYKFSTRLDLIHYPITESIRYLDVHPVLPEPSPPELQDSYNALLAPLLLNSALAAIRAKPQSSANAMIAIANATRALDKLQLNNADKGTCSLLTIVIHDRYSRYHYHFASESVVPSCSCSCVLEDRRAC